MPNEREDVEFYEYWMEKEGIPVYKTLCGVEDVSELPRRPWARLGGYGTFIEAPGFKPTGRLLYVAEIPAGKALEPEKHIYEESIYILRGRGLSEVWQEGESKRTFEWGERSLFDMPLNAWHRLVNGGREPVLFIATTNAPRIMDIYHDTEFIFNCDYKFTNRYAGQANYFQPGEKRYKTGVRPVWETNFVPDLLTNLLDDMPEKAGPGGQITWFRMSSGYTHASQWPAGRYHKAHYHGPGAVLLVLQSVGYALVWPREYGIHPFQDGHGDKVMRTDWKPGGFYTSGGSEYGDWYHQHFNTGPEPARHLAFGASYNKEKNLDWASGGAVKADWAVMRSVRDKRGGQLVEYEDEDPEIRRMFEEELRKRGVKCTMEPVVYRTDPLKLSL